VARGHTLNAIHFGSDFAGTLAVLAGLGAAAAGYPGGDSIAALFVAALVLLAAGRLIRRNVDVLMDRAPAEAEAAARAAIAGIEPPVSLSRLRLRQAAGRTFADVVISVPPGAAVGQGHAVADRVEAELEDALPGSDVVVHVEPTADEAALRDRALAAAMTVPQVREIHNLSLVSLGGDTEVSLHLKLPGDLPLDQAHEIAEQVERAIITSVPEITSGQTHLEPLSEVGPANWSRRRFRLQPSGLGWAVRELRLLRTGKASSPSSRSDSTDYVARRCMRGRRGRAAAPRATRRRRCDHTEP
jgi:divalent metal cation (Fe/Co/Zn/Cd) transporter